MKYIAVLPDNSISATGDGTLESLQHSRDFLRNRKAQPELEIFYTDAHLGQLNNTKLTFDPATGKLVSLDPTVTAPDAVFIKLVVDQ